MKKLTTLIALALCLALIAPCALAQYIPGQTTNQLVEDAWNAGKLVKADMQIDLDLNKETFGFSAEDQPYLDALYYLFDSFTLSMGAAKLDNGIRVELGGVLEANSTVTADAAIDVTLDGLSVECSLLPDEKVTVRWETLLALAGVPQDDIDLIMALKDSDLAAVMDTIFGMVAPYIELAAETTAPYGDVIANWINTLSFEQYTDLEASENYPATAMLLNITITEADAANLILSLIDQVEQDALVSSLIDMLLYETTGMQNPPTTADLCAELRSTFEPYTTCVEYPISLSLGYGENGELLYAEFALTDEAGDTYYAGLFCYPTEDANTTLLDCTFFAMDAMGSIDTAVSIAGTATLDPLNAYDYAVNGDMLVIAKDETIAELALSANSALVETEDGLPGYNTDMVFNMNALDEVTMLYALVAQYAQTADGGETSDIAGAMEIYAEGETLSMTVEGAMQVVPTEEGFIAVYSIVESAPYAGLDTYGADIIYYTEEYAPAALTELAIEDMTDASMNALIMTLSEAVQKLMADMVNALPSDIVELVL